MQVVIELPEALREIRLRREMLVIADTSPLGYLTALGDMRLLPMIFGQVWAPTAR